ncbi:caspase family protein [Streptomyces europaeiscabiei]|uniref:caspase family protein n=1 Tax=Streptomyces europaeiscabiei TaxID=146819 RepID=UPI002E172C19
MTGAYTDGWALVVGIDQYSDPGIPDLRGPVRDACDTVKWLRNIGIPDDHICLHVEPSPVGQIAVNELNLAYHGAKEPDIWRSISELFKQDGSHLFIFLLGHGIFEPSAQALFLTAEADTSGSMTNLGIDWHINQFLAMDFEEQLLVMDGCLNYPYGIFQRQTITAGKHSGVANKTPKPTNTLTCCYACSQGEEAAEIGDRGIFLQHLLPLLDIHDPDKRVLQLDSKTGQVFIDLRAAVAKFAGPQVTKVAWNARPPVKQTPFIDVEGHGRAWASPPLHLPDRSAGGLVVSVTPPTAIGDIEFILVELAEPPFWKCYSSAAPGKSVDMPFVNRLPVGSEAHVRCSLKEGVLWQSPPVKVIKVRDEAVDVEVDLALEPLPLLDQPSEPMPPALPDSPAIPNTGSLSEPSQCSSSLSIKGPVINIQAVDRAGGSGRFTFDAARLGALDAQAEALGLSITGSESSSVISAPSQARDEILRLASDAVLQFDHETPKDIAAFMVIEEPLQAPRPLTTLRISFATGGPQRLAGPLAETPCVTVNDRLEFTLQQISENPIIEVAPGVTTVDIQLPWGSWTGRTTVTEGDATEITLPNEVGVYSPLRVTVPPSRWEKMPGGTVIGYGDVPTHATAHELGSGNIPIRVTSEGQGYWSLVADSEKLVRKWGVIFSDGQGVNLPLHPRLPVGLIDDSAGRLRAEPLCATRNSEWDELVCLGNLRARFAAPALSDSVDDSDILLSLAKAYAHFAAARHDEAIGVLNAIHEVESELIADVAILEAFIGLQSGPVTAPSIRDALEQCASNNFVPVFRWGIIPALEIAGRLGLEDWVKQLEIIAMSCSRLCTWTTWRA